MKASKERRADGRRAVVTGATSGLGLEAAAQLAEAGFSSVVVTGRTLERAASAAKQLKKRTGRDVFRPVELDLADASSVQRAASATIQVNDESGGGGIEFLLLNAGMIPAKQQVLTRAGVEISAASSIIGHHQLTHHLLRAKAIRDNGRIVIAGSEAARGDVPMMKLIDLGDLAKEHHQGDRVAAAESILRGKATKKYHALSTYANTKLLVVWWAAALARELPEGISVNAISPGATGSTDAARHQSFLMRRVMAPMMRMMPASMDMGSTVQNGAARYLQALEFGPEISGQFFASRPKKMSGELTEMHAPQLSNRTHQDAAWAAINRVAGIMVSDGCANH